MKNAVSIPKTTATVNLSFLTCLILSCYLILQSQAYADTCTTYYVCNDGATCNGGEGSGWSTGNNSNACTEESAPCLTLRGGLEKMSGGDTLIIGDGTYTGGGNSIQRHHSFPEGNNGPDYTDGTADDVYTTVTAENDGRVIIDGQVIYLNGSETISGVPGEYPSKNFIILKGLVVLNAPGGISLSNVKYIKVINCGANQGSRALSGAASIKARYSSYILFEGCFAWGNTEYYVMQATQSDHLIWRNCVIRYDRSISVSAQCGALANYSCSNNEVQNCIIIDGDSGYQNLGNYDGTQGLFANPASKARVDGDYAPIRFNNVIALNNTQRFSTCDRNDRNFCQFTNAIGWDLNIPPQAIRNVAPEDYQPSPFEGSSGKVSYDKCTFGDVDTFDGDPVDEVSTWKGMFNGMSDSDTVKNSIIHGFNGGSLFAGYEELVYLNVTAFPQQYDIIKSGVSITHLSTHPLTNLYLPRIDMPSLKTAGENGGRIGAEIFYQYGKSGTMWGEPGYNLLQDGTNGQDTVRLWPFPNENIIKKYVQTYSFPGDTDHPAINGDRGFASSTAKQLDGVNDVTLTSYIWEYLGNQMPCEIYGTCADNDCTEGEISQTCICNGEERSSGFCCDGTWNEDACRVLNYGFEDWTGDANTTPNYIFGTSYQQYWDIHTASTEVVASCGDWIPHSGNYFFYRQHWTGGTDSCLNGTAISLNDHGNIGIPDLTYGHNSAFDLRESTDKEVFIKFWFITNGYYSNMAGGYRNKFIRIYTDQEAAYAHLSENGGIHLYNHSVGWGPEIPWPGGSPLGDGQWHSIALYVDLTNNDNYQGVTKVWLDTDESNAPTYESHEHHWGGATYFDHIALQQNFSGDTPGQSTVIGIDDLEIWDGIPSAFDGDGDINSDGTVNLTDTVLALQLAAGREPIGITSEGDVNGDGKINIAEAIMVLRKISE